MRAWICLSKLLLPVGFQPSALRSYNRYDHCTYLNLLERSLLIFPLGVLDKSSN